MEIRRVDRGFNLYVDVTAACNASCPFCIAPTMERRDGPQFFDGLRWGLNFTQKHGGSVQITGGEPTLSRRLPKVLDEVRARRFHRVVLNTNGSGLRDVDGLATSGVTHVNISRHHYDAGKNQQVMRIRPEAWASNERLAEAVGFVHSLGIPVRLNCCLIHGMIDSLAEIERYVAWAQSLGVFSVAFSEVFPLSQFGHQVPLVDGWTETNSVDLPGIVASLDRRWTPDRSQRVGLSSVWGQGSSTWGHSTWIGSDLEGGHRRFWTTDAGGEVSIKTLAGWNRDGSPKSPVYDRATDPELQEGEVFFAVVHPDGVVSASWDKRERVLFSSDPACNIALERMRLRLGGVHGDQL